MSFLAIQEMLDDPLVAEILEALGDRAVAAGFHRLGGARWRRREASVRRRRCSSMRSIVFGSVMNDTIRISSPHRGHASGSTSKMRLSNSAQRRLALRTVSGSGSTITGVIVSLSLPAFRRMPLTRDA